MFGQTFGVEIEANGLYPDNLRQKFRDHRGCLKPRGESGLFYPRNRHWVFQLKHDCSVNGTEFTTPPMTEENLPLLDRVVEDLKAFGMSRTSRGCGIHVHVGLQEGWSENRKWRELSDRLYRQWRALRGKIDDTFGPSPGRRSYARMNFTKEGAMYDRFVGMNMTKDHYDTVEFRIFDSKLDQDWVHRAIKFSCGFMALAKLSKGVKNSPRANIETIMSRSLGE